MNEQKILCWALKCYRDSMRCYGSGLRGAVSDLGIGDLGCLSSQRMPCQNQDLEDVK